MVESCGSTSSIQDMYFVESIKAKLILQSCFYLGDLEHFIIIRLSAVRLKLVSGLDILINFCREF